MKIDPRSPSPEPAPESENSGVRVRGSIQMERVSPAERGVKLQEKLVAARALQRRLPFDSRDLQLLSIAMLRRDEALLDALLKRVLQPASSAPARAANANGASGTAQVGRIVRAPRNRF